MFVYEIHNTVNDKRYVGQSSQETQHRLLEHRSKLRSGVHENDHLQRAWNKYGEEAFEFCIITEGKSIRELNKLEQKYIQKYNSIDRDFGYNIRTGGENSRLSEETKRKISESKKGVSVHTPESIEKIRESLTGRKHSKESRLKRSRKLKGYEWPIEVRNRWARAHRNGKPYPPVVSPEGKIHRNIVNMTEFCKKHGLRQQGMSRLVNREKWIKSYKGWKLLEE